MRNGEALIFICTVLLSMLMGAVFMDAHRGGSERSAYINGQMDALDGYIMPEAELMYEWYMDGRLKVQGWTPYGETGRLHRHTDEAVEAVNE